MTGYFLQVRTPNGPWNRVNNIPVTGTEVRVTRLQSNSSYEFRLAAMNDNGLGEFGVASAPVVPSTQNRPTQPVFSKSVNTLSGWFFTIRAAMLLAISVE